MHSQGKTLLIRTILLLVYGFAGAGIFTLIEKQDESNKAISNRMLQQLKKNFTKQHNMSDEEFEFFAMAAYKRCSYWFISRLDLLQGGGFHLLCYDNDW